MASEGDSLGQGAEREGEDPEGVVEASEASVTETRCPICLGDCEDKAFIDACFHCFTCIVQWAEMTNSCPMCKTSFKTVIHNVKANDDYDQFEIKPNPTPSQQEISLSEARRIFRYRTTRRLRGQDQFGRQRYQSNLRESRKPAAEQRRRAVYSTGLRALPLESEGRRSRVRNISASFFRENPASMHRLFPWLSREFKVLLGEEHVEFMIQIVVSLIDKVDLESEEFARHLEPYLHGKTAHFMDELISFSRSPYDMIAYDNRVSYAWPANRAPPRDMWDPDDDTQDVAGPSSAVNMQQRILEELTTAGWDDSPPLMPRDSPTAIIIHDSDSDPALSPVHTSQSPVHASQSPAHTALSPVHASQSPAHTALSPVHTALSPVHASQSPAHTSQGKGSVNPISQEAQPPYSSNTANVTIAVDSTEISSTTDPVSDDLTCTITEVVPASSIAAVVGNSTSPEATLTGSIQEELEDSYAISIYAEDMDLESSYERKEPKGKGKERARGRRKSHSDSDKEDRSHRRRRRSSTSSSSDEHKSSRRRNREDKSYRKDRGHCRRDEYERRRHRRHREDDYRRNERRRSPLGGYRGDHDYERDTYTSSGSYFERETHCHRTRLYSDDHTSPIRIPSAVTVVSPSKKHDQKSSANSGLGSSRRGESESRHEMSSHGRRHHRRREGLQHHEHPEVKDKHLSEELNELEEQIRESKKQLLKSVLYRERLELLHKKLHGGGLARQPKDIQLEDIKPARITEATSTNDMLTELVFVDQAIKDGKRQVLRIMKRIEEQHVEKDVDSN